jgi:hypothetical protein
VAVQKASRHWYALSLSCAPSLHQTFDFFPNKSSPHNHHYHSVIIASLLTNSPLDVTLHHSVVIPLILIAIQMSINTHFTFHHSPAIPHPIVVITASLNFIRAKFEIQRDAPYK